MNKYINEFYRKGIILNGEFKLKSGQISNYYINCRKLFEYPNLIKEISQDIINNFIKNKKIDWICGVPNGAIPLASSISILSGIPLLLLRKEKKDHGLCNQIDGDFKVGDKVIIIEDVVTTGGSLNEFSKLLLNNNLNIISKICIINRGNIENIKSLVSYDFNSSLKNLLISNIKNNIIWAADCNNMKELFLKMDKILKSNIKIIKFHMDTFIDFNEENLLKLIEYKKKYNLIYWEDRKFADIGNIMDKQIKNSIYKYHLWNDIFSIHGITGEESIISTIKNNLNFKWILIGELSSTNNLIDNNYTNKVKKIYNLHENIIGIVCQNYLGPEFIHIVPGISNNLNNDNQGQKYNSIENKNFADFYVIGRSIDNFLN